MSHNHNTSENDLTVRRQVVASATTPLYLSAPDAVALVRRKGLKNCIADIADHIRTDFLRWPDFDKSARVANHSKDGVIELMPISDDTAYSFKYVNGHPKNTAIGLSTVMAFGVMADVATGAPTLVSELTLTTALRTAATSALAAKTLARPDSRVMALIGNGAQSEFQAIAFQHLVGIDTVRLFDIDAQATAELLHKDIFTALNGKANMNFKVSWKRSNRNGLHQAKQYSTCLSVSQVRHSRLAARRNPHSAYSHSQRIEYRRDKSD
jgi:ornithine cyclodeaminase/alanine dehydrogenase-like protein (mu-crystallin family)